ncbi:Gfo/Idh/MocA family protein [Leeuwenhoekiella sp. A16]|uniref:Gfo/Idh/MocA family protein n=1 Tax=unclassified Leeuwenhoekiella TaxID=2615029 RepID=UPI003A7FB95C
MKLNTKNNDRRRFIKNMSLGLGATVTGVPVLSSFSGDLATALDEAVGNDQDTKKGIALVGLGGYSTGQLAPALEQTKNCYLAGIVTGTPDKVDAWKSKYNIPDKNVYNYENFDEIADNDDIDIIYIVLPNSMHADYVVRAAKTKKDIICEKPMATNVADAQRMIDACKENGVKLAIGYRLHFEPFNKRVAELGQQKLFGKVTEVKANFSEDMTSGKPNVWRLNKEMAGGGPLMDLGIYCVQGVIYTLGKTPIAVTAEFGEVTKPTYFFDVEQSIKWKMEFDDGFVAECESSYAKAEDLLYGKAERGWWKLSPAYSYDGKKGQTMEGPMDFENVYEQANQMDSQATHFSKDQQSIVPGEMGLRDLKILMAIYESAEGGGKRVEIS